MKQNNNTVKIGKIGEDYVCRYLENMGYEIALRNYKIRGGEIDIIAIKDDIIAFIEVKTRKISSVSSGLEAIDRNKMKRIIKTAQNYMWKEAVELQPRYDTAEVIYDNQKISKFSYIENAFDATDFCNIF
jgi:putative endonuclease